LRDENSTKKTSNFPIDCSSKKSSKKFHSKSQIVSLEFLDFFFSFVQLERELARTSGKQLKSWIKNWNWNWWIGLGVDLKEKMKSQKVLFGLIYLLIQMAINRSCFCSVFWFSVNWVGVLLRRLKGEDLDEKWFFKWTRIRWILNLKTSIKFGVLCKNRLVQIWWKLWKMVPKS
jgi:hypothetical protein